MYLGMAMRVNIAQAGAPQHAGLPCGWGRRVQRGAQLSGAGAHLSCQAVPAVAQAQAAARLARLGAKTGLIQCM